MVPLTLASFITAVYNGYLYFFYLPEPIAFVWDTLKTDSWLEEQLGAPLRIAGSWSGYVHDEEAKFTIPLAGSKKNRSGAVVADVIRAPNTENWDIVSIRFGRTDAEAAPAGIESSSTGLMFTSNQGPGTTTTVVPLAAMPALPNGATDDITASQQGYSATTTPSGCPYQPRTPASR